MDAKKKPKEIEGDSMFEEPTKVKVKKVYCIECKLFWMGGDFSGPTCITDKIETYPEEESFLRPASTSGIRVIADPAIKNKNNDCKEFKAK